MDEIFAEKLSSPLVVFWELTRRCNLKCRHCYTHSSFDNSQLDDEKLFKILEVLCKQNIFSLGLGGGEPLMVKCLPKIINIAKQNQIDISLSTNGILVTDNYAVELKNAGLTLAQVSIDGLEAVHDNIRGKGSFKKAARALKTFKKHGIVTRFAITVNKLNCHQIDDVFKLALEFDADWFIAFRYMTSGREGDALAMSREELYQVTNSLINLQKKYPNKVFFEKLVFFPFLIDDNYASKKLCNAGKSIMNVSFNGDVTPCPHVTDYTMGNILKDDFNSIWNNPKMEMPECISTNCEHCKHSADCAGGCKGVLRQNELQKDSLCWGGNMGVVFYALSLFKYNNKWN